MFEGFFKRPAENVNMYLSTPNFIDSIFKSGGSQKEILESISTFLVTDKPLSFDECIVWARLKFEEYFNNSIRQLLYNFPKDSVSEPCALLYLPLLFTA